jgi:hypothetical protein
MLALDVDIKSDYSGSVSNKAPVEVN